MVPMVEEATTCPLPFVERRLWVILGKKNEVPAERLVVEALVAVKSEPLKVRPVDSVKRVPLK